MNNKINNKGFTLIELIIAMTILSVVLGLGYKVIIGTNKATKHQTQVFSEQQNANLINKYLTKDLEQVRSFTITEDKSLNTYSYILNEGIDVSEQIEYKVEKIDDGKFYTLTRIAGSTSIELISNYPTNSEVPFSISKVNGTDNIFKVTFNGKIINNNVDKYQFEVTSRLENIVAMDDTINPPINGEGSTGGNDGENTEGGENQNPPENKYILNGEIRFEFYHQNGNKDKVTVIAIADTNDETKDKDHRDSTKGNINKPDIYTIKAKIPVKPSKDLPIYVTNCSWKLEESFGGDWSKPFNSNFVNDAIHIYPGRGVNVKSLKIAGENPEYKEGTYYFPLSQISEATVLVEIEISISDYTNEPYLTIGFGNYKKESNK